MTFDWITHERDRLFTEAEARDHAALEAEQRHISELLGASPVVGLAAGGGVLSRPAPAHIPDSPMARLARKRDRQRRVYQIGTGLLIAAVVAALAGSIITQVNAARLDWPEIQERTKW